MTMRPGIIISAVPFASRADRVRKSSVMSLIIADDVAVRQIMPFGNDNHKQRYVVG